MAKARSLESFKIVAELPGPVAADFFECRDYFSACMGPLGSGKTQTTILKLLALMGEQEPNAAGVRPTRLLAIRNTYPDLETTTIRDWVAMTSNLGKIKYTHPPTQHLEWKCPDGTTVECDVIFLALDREDHVKKLRGTQATFVWLNELKELPRAVIDMATRPLGRYPSLALGGVRCTREAMVGDFNAPDIDHWAAVMMTRSTEGWSFFRQPGAVFKDAGGIWHVNPQAENIENLPPDYYKKMLGNKREDWILVNLANEFGSSVDGKPIHPEYSQTTHCREFEVRKDLPVLFGQDYGLTPACVMAQESNGQVRVFDEIVTENFSAAELAEAMKLRLAKDWPGLEWGNGWGDPSGKDPAQADKNTPFHVMRGAGFKLMPAGTNNSFMLRRDALGNRLKRLNLMGEPALLVHPRCRIVNKGLAGHYQFKRLQVAGDDRYHDVPDKTIYSHVCEALQYLSVGLGDGLALMGDNDDWKRNRNDTQGVRRARR